MGSRVFAMLLVAMVLAACRSTAGISEPLPLLVVTPDASPPVVRLEIEVPAPAPSARTVEASAGASSMPTPEPPPEHALPPEPVARSAAQAGNGFTLDLYPRVRLRDSNFVFSGQSAAIALAVVSAGARGATRSEMDRALHLESVSDASAAFGALLRRLNDLDGKDGVELHVANALWGQQGTPFEASYLSRIARDFGAPLREVDFIHGGAAVTAQINGWVDAETNDRIRSLFDSPLGVSTRLVVTNAIYFKGKWTSPFAISATKPQPFFAASSTFQTPTMSRRIDVSYAHVDGVQVVELPYYGGLSMLVALPDAKKGLAGVEDHLAQRYEGWRAALARSSPQEVDVELPKWRASWRGGLTPALSELGIRRAFRRDAEFEGICSKDRLRIDDVFQEAFVEVNEEGSEAAAATGAVMVALSLVIRATPPPTFHADHPFLYAIRDPATDAILFVGHVVDPRLAD